MLPPEERREHDHVILRRVQRPIRLVRNPRPPQRRATLKPQVAQLEDVW